MTLPPAVTYKVENVPNELGNLAKEIFRQNVEGVPGLFLLHILKRERREISQKKDR